MPLQALPYIFTVGILFGSTLVASRFSIGQFESVTYIALRLTLAGLMHAIIYIFSIQGRKWPNGQDLWLRSTVMGIFGAAIPMNLIVGSLNYQSSGVTSILITLNPAITVLLAHFYLNDERLNRRKMFGISLALSGAIFMVAMGETGLPDVSQANPLGYLMVFSAMISASFATVYARKHMQEMDAFDVASIRMWVSALVTIPASLILVGFNLSKVNSQGYVALGWASLVGTFLGMILSFYIIKRFGATPSAMTAYVIPIVSSIGGVFLLDERITFGMVVGIALMLTGILVINRRSSKVPSPITG